MGSIDLFVVPTLSFRLLHGLLILWHGRRQILWLGVTSNPTAQWVARQFTEACGWEKAPSYIIRDCDRVMASFSPGGFAPWAFVTGQLRYASHGRNGHTERLIGSIRRECLDHVVVFMERQLWL
jgi:hypothetical protein